MRYLALFLALLLLAACVPQGYRAAYPNQAPQVAQYSIQAPAWYAQNLSQRRLMPPEASPSFAPVPIRRLAGLKNLQKSLNQEQFQQAYSLAVRIAAPISGLPREQQLAWVAKSVREAYESNGGVYSTNKSDKYNTPYGLLVLGRGSCAGSARTTCLVLSILGIPNEHINPNQWRHQWARVPMGNEYWICDPFGLYVGPEIEPRRHPNTRMN